MTTTTTTIAEEEETKDSETSSNTTTIAVPLPVDRQWLSKLLQRYHGSGSGTTTDYYDDNDDKLSATTPVVVVAAAYVLAPMVEQSDLAFRLLCRRYGVSLCFTPMIHAKLYCTMPAYRQRFTLEKIPSADRPLIAQLCGSSENPDIVLKAAQLLEPYCDGIDLNCGCPQGIARRGQYGAFLLEQPEKLVKLVSHLTRHLKVPVSVKVRLLPGSSRQESLERSLQLYRQLVYQGGIHMLTIHGRTRFHKGPDTGPADWEAIRTIVQELGPVIPILANGSIASLQEAQECLKVTGADGVMSSEAILEYPALFSTASSGSPNHRTVGRVQLAREYLALARQYPPDQGGQGSNGIKCIRIHIHRLLHADLQSNTKLRQDVIDANSMQELERAVQEVQTLHEKSGHDVQDEQLSWYMRHRQIVRNQANGITINLSEAGERWKREATVKSVDLADDAAECFACLFDNDDEEY